MTVSNVPLLPKQISWLVDTSASEDLIGTQTVKENRIQYKTEVNPKVFATAGGLITVNRKANIKINGIDETITPWIADMRG